MRNLIIVLVIVLMLVSCGGENTALPEPETADEVVEIKATAFIPSFNLSTLSTCANTAFLLPFTVFQI